MNHPARKVVAMGETIMDIIFHDDQPTAAVPGGSAFNCIISLGRAGVNALFMGETGADEVGTRITTFLKENHVDSRYLMQRDDVKSAISLAFLDENNDAHYSFYKQPPQLRPDAPRPVVEADDVITFGSYYAISDTTRQGVHEFLQYARKQGAILYYDLNFRKSHAHELEHLTPALHDNFHLAHIVRGSADDFEVMYGERDATTIYRKHIAPHCPLFICTHGGEGISVCTPQGTMHFDVPHIATVSTIGAGDNFNAGFIYGLMLYGIKHSDLLHLTAAQWEQLIEQGREFSLCVVASVHNSIDAQFATQKKQALTTTSLHRD